MTDSINNPSKRIAIGLEYDGSNYHGWQSQEAHLITVQNEVETAFSKVADQPIRIYCAGRTDVGVHAVNQVIHFDTDKKRTIDAWVLGANSYLKKDIRVKWAQEMPSDFHARFSAIARHYRYIIHNSKQQSALLRNRACWYPWQLDANAMDKAIAYLLGEHDFSAFRASSCQSLSTNRCVHIAQVTRYEDCISIEIKANAFLHHMVRNIVGALFLIGRGEKQPIWMKELLDGRDRTQGGVTAKANGLYLLAVTYRSEYSLPQMTTSHMRAVF